MALRSVIVPTRSLLNVGWPTGGPPSGVWGTSGDGSSLCVGELLLEGRTTFQTIRNACGGGGFQLWEVPDSGRSAIHVPADLSGVLDTVLLALCFTATKFSLPP